MMVEKRKIFLRRIEKYIFFLNIMHLWRHLSVAKFNFFLSCICDCFCSPQNLYLKIQFSFYICDRFYLLQHSSSFYPLHMQQFLCATMFKINSVLHLLQILFTTKVVFFCLTFVSDLDPQQMFGRKKIPPQISFKKKKLTFSFAWDLGRRKIAWVLCPLKFQLQNLYFF